MAKKKGKKKRVVVLSDLHCGHYAGLTPKQYWQRNTPQFEQQRKMWNFFVKEIENLKPIDLVVVNGDTIDGRGERSGGTELITSDRKTQIFMAEECVKVCEAKEYKFVYGTPYHTGKEEDWESVLGRLFNTEPTGHAMFKYGGLVWDIKHKIGGSTVPHGAATPILKEKLWNTIWTMYNGQKEANIVIRSHVHKFLYVGDNKFMCVVTPGLQGFGSKYGTRQCSGIIHIGFVYFDVYDNGEIDWGSKIMEYEVMEKEDGTLDPRIKG